MGCEKFKVLRKMFLKWYKEVFKEEQRVFKTECKKSKIFEGKVFTSGKRSSKSGIKIIESGMQKVLNL